MQYFYYQKVQNRPWVDYRRLDSETEPVQVPTAAVPAASAAAASSPPTPAASPASASPPPSPPTPAASVSPPTPPAAAAASPQPENGNGNNIVHAPPPTPAAAAAAAEEYQEEDSDGNGDDVNYEDNYMDVLHSVSKKWLCTQLTHKVSAAATNTFWDIALSCLPKVMDFKEREGISKNIPHFIQQRRKLYEECCPKIQMEFAFQRKDDGSIIKYLGTTAPLKEYQRNPDYIKLYEIASIKVI